MRVLPVGGRRHAEEFVEQFLMIRFAIGQDLFAQSAQQMSGNSLPIHQIWPKCRLAHYRFQDIRRNLRIVFANDKGHQSLLGRIPHDYVLVSIHDQSWVGVVFLQYQLQCIQNWFHFSAAEF